VNRFASYENQNGHLPILQNRRKHFTSENVSYCDNPQLSGRAACRSGHLAVYLLVLQRPRAHARRKINIPNFAAVLWVQIRDAKFIDPTEAAPFGGLNLEAWES